MGSSLARNIASKGFRVSLYNRHLPGQEERVAEKAAQAYAELQQALPFDELAPFVASLARPRKILLMVSAGPAVDQLIEQLSPLLDRGDLLIDGGNSHYKETLQRQARLQAQGLHFLGTGISGGEEGARKGPAIMPGGDRAGFDLAKDILYAIAAKNEQQQPCCGYIGEGGAGHFVKMAHNGIEYAEMQLIAEVYTYLRYDRLLPLDAIAEQFRQWQSEEDHSYLLGITADILPFKAADGQPLLDQIADVAGSKGTGSWTTVAACELGVPIPTIAAALFARYLSAQKSARTSYAARYPKGTIAAPYADMPALRHAYRFARILNHHQGLALIQAAADQHAWQIDLDSLLQTWSGGCIIRSELLDTFRRGLADGQADLLAQPYVQDFIKQQLPGIQSTLGKLALSPQPYPCLSASLDYFKSLSAAQSSANLIQAQRDYFGAHTYQRADDPSGKAHHTQWY